MAKNRREARLRAGESLLSEWDIGTDVASLEAAFGRDAAADMAIAARLGSVADGSSVEALQRIDERADKEVRKEIKRALFRLEQRGVDVPRPERERRAINLAPSIEGYLSAFDGRGDRLVWLVKPGSGGVQHLFAVVNDPAGLREVAVNRLTRKALREIQRELERKHDIRFVPVDWRRADAVLQEGVRWAREREGSVQGDYTSLRSHLTSEAATEEAAGPLDEMPALLGQDASERASHVAGSAEVLLEPEMRTWLLDEGVARGAVDELQEVGQSPLVLNEAQQEERFNVVYARVVHETFDAHNMESWARRLEEMAYYFASTSRGASAARSAAVAAALRAGDDAADIPFCAIYVRRTLGMYLQQGEQQKEEERKSSLIVTPDEVRKQQRQRR